jgi:hypothetical protein
MRSRDFLHKHAETPFCEHYSAAGALCSISTNCKQLLEAARESFLPVEPPPGSVDFRLRLWVDEADSAQPPWPKPYVRAVDHCVFLGFGSGSSMLADLHTRRVIGRFSAAMAGGTVYWRTVIFPMLLSILAGSIGLVELHASCVARDEQGLLLIGPSRSGKSTLALALSQTGFRLLSDDRTFCSFRRDKLQAYGLPRPLKLRHDAASWFDEFHDQEPIDVQNGERVFYCEPNGRSGRQTLAGCEPRVLLFLERQQGSSFCMTQIERGEVRRRIELDLLAEAPVSIQKQEETLEKLLTIPSWQLRYGASPQVIAEQIGVAFSSSSELNYAS